MVMNLEYHKGSFCVYSPVFCQEGFCNGCELFKRHQDMGRQKIQEDKKARVLGSTETKPNLLDIPGSKIKNARDEKLALNSRS